MSTATPPSKVSPPTGGSRGSKLRPTKIILLKLPSALLLQYPHEPVVRKPSVVKPPPTVSTPVVKKESPPATDSTSDSKSAVVTDVPTTLQVPTESGKKKGIGGPKPGTKRSLGSLSEGLSKPRAKPGPKKRPRLDGTLPGDETTRPWTTPAPVAGHKLGPKANQGAINAGLRALDRTGKPCRKWEKKRFNVKSFTGIMWEIPSWRAPKKAVIDMNGEGVKSETTTSTSENHANPESSNVGSDNSRSGGMDTSQVVGSPLLSVATPA